MRLLWRLCSGIVWLRLRLWIARSLYRSGESVRCLTLEEVGVTTIDMLTVVLIGNSRTFLHQGRMITPRGYKV
ncbi:MAG: hypothetical protein AAF821_26200 [Cyanobacteria bacterium P01_D01_bin.156]